LKQFTDDRIIHLGTVLSAIEQAGSNSEAKRAADALVDGLPVNVLKHFQQFFASTDVEMSFYKALGRVKHILDDWENSATLISTDMVLSTYFVASLFVNSTTASGKKGSGAEAPITLLRDGMVKVMDDLAALDLTDNTILNGNCEGIGILHYILHLDDGAGNISDARKVDVAADAKKIEFQEFGRCKRNKDRLAADRLIVDKCLTDCSAYNMIANVQKIRMFTAMHAKTGITWGRVAS